MQTEAKNLLKVQNLSAHIGRQVVLDDVSFDVEKGECVAIVGGSGAGKSTLLRCLMGLRRPAEPVGGFLTFDGVTREFGSAGRTGKPKGIAYVPQNPDHGFDPLKRLQWQWRQTARAVTGSKEFSALQQELLRELGLGSFHGRFPHQWSRGMQQRLLVGMALLGEPSLLILDEPTSALDPLIAAQVLRSVMAYAHKHEVALLIVTHDLALAAQHANRTAIMTSGQVVEFGETRELLRAPETTYGQLLVNHRDWNFSVHQKAADSVAAE
ncbi:Arginine transport ATP-binding protein ArtM [Labrenzia sp. THAF82]|uniref:ABC transporter ATP-binding protein n=1 Tax=Labrenzia sp. THAF82 TaxID=2587861 RepID=UPI0012A8CEC9|nr:ATP-binding cassette domain-containing protein [Labrenzia sp. THAF82]QFT31334.1 Arginine transport ATP-binding protein ArtM [Labrenzia sp. THAF82]